MKKKKDVPREEERSSEEGKIWKELERIVELTNKFLSFKLHFLSKESDSFLN